MGSLEGKVAIISGAASGMGAQHARTFIEQSAKVLVGDVSADAGQALADELGANAIFHRLDVTDPASWKEAISAANEAFGPVTVLVNNAGISGPHVPTTESSDEDYLKTVDVDQHGIFYGMRAVIPGMIEAGGGSIVNISSVVGFVYSGPNAAYAAAKYAVRGLTKAGAVEFGDKNVRVNSVHPGAVWTPMLQAQQKEALDAYSATIPMKRFAKMEEISNVVAFLASDASSYVTGHEHVVDGGSLAG